MTDFFNSVGMEYVVIGLAAALLLALILVIVALVKVGKLKKRYEKFLSGKDGKSLEESIVKRFDKLNEIIVEQDFLEQEISLSEGQMFVSFLFFLQSLYRHKKGLRLDRYKQVNPLDQSYLTTQSRYPYSIYGKSPLLLLLFLTPRSQIFD